jgi:predicted DnaQ family exonuclease/DinG family helicase
MERIYVALDLEFTGLDYKRDEIIEIGMVRFKGDQVLETFSSLVSSRRAVPYKIQQLVGISQAEIDVAPTLQSLTGKILGFVKSYPLVAHTISTDLQFLRQYGLPLNNLAIDTFELAGILVPEAQRYSLANLAQLLGIDLPQNHRALPDALATKDLFLALVGRAYRWDLQTLEEINRLSEGTDWPLRQVLRDIAQERRRQQGTELLTQRVDSAPRLDLAPRNEEDSPPLEPTEVITPVDAEQLSALIAPDGPFARAFPGYEHRRQQVEMLQAVARAFNTPAHLLVEAGTGTGKSVAYLLPAIYFALQNGRRVVISSNTINLQDQLFNKDLPDLQRILHLDFRAALLKGRSNYLCLRRLAVLRRSRQLTADEARVLAKVLVWLPTTRTGDRTELLLVNSEFGVWSHIQADAELCLSDQCPYHQTGRCFFYRVRARAERAHLIVVNHALLLADMALDNRVLPEYKYLVIDEAHHLEEQATDQFGIQVSRGDVYAFLVGLSRAENATAGSASNPSGLVGKVPAMFRYEGVTSSAQQAITTTIQALQSDIDSSERRLYELFNCVSVILGNHTQLRTNAQETYDQHISLTNGLRSQPDWSTLEMAWESFSGPMAQVIHGLERLQAQVEGLALGENAERDELAQEIKAQVQRGTQMWMGMGQILMKPEAQGIYWLSVARPDQEITLCSAPLHVGPMLRERLFNNTDCVVLTSATLRTGDSFHFIESRIGLEDPQELALDSPFNFQSSVLLFVPKDVPEPNEPYYQKNVEQALVDLAKATEGRMLVLFTSSSQLNTTYRAIQGPLERENIVVFGQGMDGSRRQILDSFRVTPRSVLMGTRSFWEGVDVVGQALSCLVITRLPFAVPTDPIFSARAATFSDPFNEYYLPDSILRFRQGFGRLIRSKEDFGLVVVLDKRLLTKPYGKMILRSLPPCTARQGPLAKLPELACRWLDPQNRK